MRQREREELFKAALNDAIKQELTCSPDVGPLCFMQGLKHDEAK